MAELTNKIDNIFFAVVVYNKECADCPSIQFALKHRDKLMLIIVDNSTIETKNKLFCEKEKICYLSMGENSGLAKAYNRVLEYIFSICDNGVVVWADDDTEFPDDYPKEVKKVFLLDKISVAIPVVYSNRDIYSPNIIDNNGLPRRIKSLDDLSGKLYGINSGMAVDLKVYKTFRYDEQFFLDFIDHDFCAYCNDNGLIIQLMHNVVLIQNSFFASRIVLIKTLQRRKLYRKDFLYFCRKHKVNRLIAWKKIIHGELATMAKYINQLAHMI